MVTGIDTLAAEQVPRDGVRSRRRFRWGAAVAVALVAVLIVGSQWPVPYFAFQPGSATPTSPLIEIDGLERFEPDGTLYFTTVSSRETNVWDWVFSRFDPSVDLVSRDSVLGGRTPEQRRDDNLQAMMSSQETAELVALQFLGFEVIELTGALIAAVVPDSAADGVLDVGDVVVAIDGQQVDSQADLVAIIGDRSPGDGIELVVRPAGETATEARALVLGRNDEGRALMGVSVTSDIHPVADLPFDLAIDAGNVGGPSAGLAWTLTVIDLLTEGELTGGQRVATTGTMALDGTVGPIGGITQKTYAVREQGIDVFLVPEADAAEAKEHAGDELTVIGVADLAEAVAALASVGGDVEGVADSADELLAG